MLRITYLSDSQPAQGDDPGRQGDEAQQHPNVGGAIPKHMEGGAALAAVVAAALHGRGQLVGPAEGADEQGHQNGPQGPGPLEDIAGFKVRGPGPSGRT